MRQIVNANLSYGLVNVPVGVCTSAARKSPQFRSLHKECGTPLQQKMWCPVCDEDVLGDDVVKGFEFVKKSFVQLESDELDAIASERSKTISILKFIPWEQGELQVEKSYLLNPNPSLVRPYALLSNAMGSRGAVGIGITSLWGKDYPSMVWAKASGVLVLSMLYCHDEVVSDEEIAAQIPAVSDEEQELANMLVAAGMRDLDPRRDLVSPSRERIEDYIAAKIAGESFEAREPEVEQAPTVDILETLRKSIELMRTAA